MQTFMPQAKLASLVMGMLLATALLIRPADHASAQTYTETNPDITIAGCTVTVTFTASQAGNYEVQYFDDGLQVHGDSFMGVTIGQNIVSDYTATTIGQAAPGILVRIRLNGSTVYLIDKLDLESSCLPIIGCSIGIPPWAVGGRLLTGSDLYYDDAATASTGVGVEAGKSITVLGRDATASWWRVWWACNLYWMPAEVLGPNFDAVWNGTPLPSNLEY
jgi:hypothetical protein